MYFYTSGFYVLKSIFKLFLRTKLFISIIILIKTWVYCKIKTTFINLKVYFLYKYIVMSHIFYFCNLLGPIFFRIIAHVQVHKYTPTQYNPILPHSYWKSVHQIPLLCLQFWILLLLDCLIFRKKNLFRYCEDGFDLICENKLLKSCFFLELN